MSAEQQDQRPKSSASSKKSATSRKSEEQQRGHQLSDDGPAPAAAAGASPDAYQQLSDDNDNQAGDAEKAEKPKKENPLKKFIASLKSLSCTGKPANLDKASKNGAQDDDENTPNARPVSQSSLESKKIVTEKNAPQIDVSPAVDEDRKSVDGKDDKKEGEEKKDDEKIASPVEPSAPLTTTVISATPPTL